LEGSEEIIQKDKGDSVNYQNHEEKKKTSFFGLLSSIIASDKKTPEINEKTPEKKQKSKRSKTDPNLFLFNDVIEEEKEETNLSSKTSEVSEISEISEIISENETVEDTDTPSYLRKGSNK